MSAPKELWVVIDGDGDFRGNPGWTEARAQENAAEMNDRTPQWAPHTVHRYVLAASPEPESREEP